MKKVFTLLVLASLIAGSVFAQSTDVIGKVVQKGTTFTVFDGKGKEITHFSSPNQQLLGSGKDFFVIYQRTTFTTYDAKCREISHISVGGSAPGSVAPDFFTVKVGSRTQKYDKYCKQKN